MKKSNCALSVISMLILSIALLSSCGGSGGKGVQPIGPPKIVETEADKIESSENPVDFLKGTYTLVILPSGQADIAVINESKLSGIANVPPTYVLTMAAQGKDSLRVTLNGTGRAGTFNNAWLGNFSAEAQKENPRSPAASKAWNPSISPYPQTYLYNFRGGLRTPILASCGSLFRRTSESGTHYTFSVSVNMFGAEMQMERKSTGVWR